MIPNINLDDRTFDDIVAEAIRLIPRYCPEWTNHNPSDPGIALIELFAWMTEMTLYRLNKVPEKTYLSLLELMGLSLVPPQPARAVIQFFPVEGCNKSISIPAGMQIAAVNADDTCIFETERKIQVHDAALVSCINRCGERWTDFFKDEALVPFTLFDSQKTVEHVLYIASPLFSALSSENYLQIRFESVNELASVQDEIANYLYWEYWNGRTWEQLVSPNNVHIQKTARKKDNTVYLTCSSKIEPCTVNGIENLYIRAVLSELPKKQTTLFVTGVTLRIFFGGSGFIPDLCVTNFGVAYSPVDMNNDFRMFSDLPAYNEIFYIAADEVLSNVGTEVRVRFTFSELYVTGEENENVVFSYEYWDGNAWQRLDQKNAFFDGTFNFKQSGEVRFIVPENAKKTAVNNVEHYWLRIRIQTKDFSIGGEYIRDEKNNWLWKFSKKVHSPQLANIRLSYEAKPQLPVQVLSNTNFSWRDLKELCIPEANEVELFHVLTDESPTLFFGFSSLFPQGDTALYIKINENKSAKPKEQLSPIFNTLLKEKSVKQKRLIDIQWEYWNGGKWEVLAVNDFTDSFHESGFIEFTVPSDMSFSSEFGKKLVWLKVCLLSGSFEKQPEIEAVILNAVYAKNVKTYTNEIAASGTGAPGQTIVPAHVPLLPGLKLSVDEGSIPGANELAVIKADGHKQPYKKEGEAVWVPYTEVDNFYNSTPFSRHFVVDYKANKIYFGDGQRGVSPVRKKFNIKLDFYQTGGGAVGNVAAHTLRVLSKNIPFITACDNPFPAEGGADMESIDSLKARAAGVFKSLQRAVTAEDFEWLAREASASVGRAYCLKEKNAHDEIVTIIIPVLPKDTALNVKLLPSRELIRRVAAHLEERKLIGTRIRVQAPVYRSFSISLKLSFKSDILDIERIKKSISVNLYTYFHILFGGLGDGWEQGKAVTTGAVLKQLERIDGILSIDSVELTDEDAKIHVEKITLKTDEFPFLTDVRIANKRGV